MTTKLNELAVLERSGQFAAQEATAEGVATAPVSLHGAFNLSLRFAGTGSVRLERSFDRGDHWGTVRSWTGSTETVLAEIERGTLYRLVCEGASAPIAWRVGQ